MLVQILGPKNEKDFFPILFFSLANFHRQLW